MQSPIQTLKEIISDRLLFWAMLLLPKGSVKRYELARRLKEYWKWRADKSKS